MKTSTSNSSLELVVEARRTGHRQLDDITTLLNLDISQVETSKGRIARFKVIGFTHDCLVLSRSVSQMVAAKLTSTVHKLRKVRVYQLLKILVTLVEGLVLREDTLDANRATRRCRSAG